MKTGFTRIFSLVLALCLMIGSAAALASCMPFSGALKFESLTVDATSIRTEYKVGDAVDFSGIKVRVRYNDSAQTRIVGADELELEYDGQPLTDPSVLTATEGAKVVTVKYFEDLVGKEWKSTTFNVTVSAAFILRFRTMTLDTSEIGTEYEIGDAVDLSGIRATVTYNDETKTKALGASDLVFTYQDGALTDLSVLTETAGEKRIVAQYADEEFDGEIRSASFTITVVDPVAPVRSISVDKTSVQTDYLVGDTVNLSGLAVTVVYNDDTPSTTIGLSDVTLEYEGAVLTDFSVLTAEAGEKIITVKYYYNENDPQQNQSAVLTLTVTEPEPVKTIFAFEPPANYLESRTAQRNAGTVAYGEDGFEGQFFAGQDTTYYAGNQNAFRFLPNYVLMDDENNQLDEDVVISTTASIGDAELDKVVEDGVLNFYDGEQKILTIRDTTTGNYYFTADAVGKDVKLSLLPDEEYVFESGKAVEITVRVVDAYNVYKASDLCVMDNETASHSWDEGGVYNWEEFKEQNGYAGVAVNGIVFQNNIVLTENDVPASFFATSEEDITVTEEGVDTILPAGTKFLYDRTELYIRRLNEGENFPIYGNYFSLAMGDFPTVASTGMAGAFARDVTYGSDFSNAVLFSFIGDITPENYTTFSADVSFGNLILIGNANRNQKHDQQNFLVSAGGLIMEKSKGCTVSFNNTISRCFFITFFPEDHLGSAPEFVKGATHVSYAKCFDSYQNGGFVWGTAELDIENSYLQRAGGPLVILQHPDPSKYPSRVPVMNSRDSILESYLAGGELWFTAVGATAYAQQILTLSDALSAYQFGAYKQGTKMNIVALVMSNGTNAADTIGNFATQGLVSVTNGEKTTLLDRRSGTALGAIVSQVGSTIYGATEKIAPVFNVGGEDAAAAGSVLFFNEMALVPPANLASGGTPLSPADPAFPAYLAAYTASDYVSLNYGGFGLLLEIHHN